MGQEISQQNKCNISSSSSSSRRQQQSHYREYQHKSSQEELENYKLEHLSKPNEKYTKRKELIYSSSSISNSSSTDDEYYKHRQKYNLSKQIYEKSKISKQLGSRKSLDSSSISSDYQLGNFREKANLYKGQSGRHQHQRNNSQSIDSGIYYSSCISTPTGFSSAASTTSGGGTSVVSVKSSKSLQKQKDYLDHHLYIKSYLDILEEDERARAQYKVAKPGGIRNYTPKILADLPLSTSAPLANGFDISKRAAKVSEDPWI